MSTEELEAALKENLERYEVLPLETPFPERGTILLFPLYQGRAHFSAYLISDRFYAQAHRKVLTGVRDGIREILPETMEENEREGMIQRLSRHVEGLGKPRLYIRDERLYLSLPRCYVEIAGLIDELDPEKMRVLPEEHLLINISEIEREALLLPAGPDSKEANNRVYEAVRARLDEKCERTLERNVNAALEHIRLRRLQTAFMPRYGAKT